MSAIDNPRLLQEKAKELRTALRKMLYQLKMVSPDRSEFDLFSKSDEEESSK